MPLEIITGDINNMDVDLMVKIVPPVKNMNVDKARAVLEREPRISRENIDKFVKSGFINKHYYYHLERSRYVESNIDNALRKHILEICDDIRILPPWVETAPDDRELLEECQERLLRKYGLDTNTDIDIHRAPIQLRLECCRAKRLMLFGIFDAYTFTQRYRSGFSEAVRYADIEPIKQKYISECYAQMLDYAKEIGAESIAVPAIRRSVGYYFDMFIGTVYSSIQSWLYRNKSPLQVYLVSPANGRHKSRFDILQEEKNKSSFEFVPEIKQTVELSPIVLNSFINQISDGIAKRLNMQNINAVKPDSAKDITPAEARAVLMRDLDFEEQKAIKAKLEKSRAEAEAALVGKIEHIKASVKAEIKSSGKSRDEYCREQVKECLSSHLKDKNGKMKITKDKLSCFIGCSPSTLSRFMGDANSEIISPKKRMVLALAVYMGLSAEERIRFAYMTEYDKYPSDDWDMCLEEILAKGITDYWEVDEELTKINPDYSFAPPEKASKEDKSPKNQLSENEK